MCSRWRGSMPLNGSSRRRIGGSWTSARGDLDPLAHALRVGPDRPVGRAGEIDGVDRRAAAAAGIRQALETRGELDELAAGQEGVDGLALGDEPDVAVDRRVAPGRPAARSSTRPDDGRAGPASMCRRVDLPAPFGPSRPVIPAPRRT